MNHSTIMLISTTMQHYDIPFVGVLGGGMDAFPPRHEQLLLTMYSEFSKFTSPHILRRSSKSNRNMWHKIGINYRPHLISMIWGGPRDGHQWGAGGGGGGKSRCALCN